MKVTIYKTITNGFYAGRLKKETVVVDKESRVDEVIDRLASKADVKHISINEAA